MTGATGVDVRRIEELYFDYADALDEDVQRWPNFFTDDAVYKAIPRENYDRGLPLASIFCEGRGMIVDRTMSVNLTTVHAPRVMRHAITNVRATAGEDGAIAARATFAIYETIGGTQSRIFLVGRYYDRIVERDARLLFAEKICVFDGNLVAGSLIYPL